MLKRHSYTIALGVPVAILLASSLSLVRSDEAIGLVCKDTRYVAVGEYFAVDIVANTTASVNVVGGAIAYPAERVEFVEHGTDDSIVDLWMNQPTLEAPGILHFEGGMVSPGGFSGTGTIAHLTFRALTEGTAEFSWEDAHLLAHDGYGTEVLERAAPLTVVVRPAGSPTPDVNQDKRVNLLDVGLVSARLFGVYDTTYDLNGDGKITLADLSIIFAQYLEGSRLGSLVVALYI